MSQLRFHRRGSPRGLPFPAAGTGAGPVALRASCCYLIDGGADGGRHDEGLGPQFIGVAIIIGKVVVALNGQAKKDAARP